MTAWPAGAGGALDAPLDAASAAGADDTVPPTGGTTDGIPMIVALRCPGPTPIPGAVDVRGGGPDGVATVGAAGAPGRRKAW